MASPVGGWLIFDEDDERRENVGLVTRDGALLGERWFEAAEVEDGGLPRVRLNGRWRSISHTGELLPDQRDGSLQLACPNGLTLLRRGDQTEVRGPDRKPASVFDEAVIWGDPCSRPLSLKREGRWFFAMQDGTVLGGEDGYDNAYGFGTGNSSAVQVNGLWGIIDRTGHYLVSPRFDKLVPKGDGIFQVGEGESISWIDSAGRLVPRPDTRPDPQTALTCPGGLSFFASDGLWGLRDELGRAVVPATHRALTCFQNGSAWAAGVGANEWCPIGTDGSRLRNLRCKAEVYPLTVTHHSPERFDPDSHENSVLWTRAWLDYLAGSRLDPPRWIPDGSGRASFSTQNRSPTTEPTKTSEGPRVSSLSGATPWIATASILAPLAGLLIRGRSHRRR